MIMVDQMLADAIGAMGHPVAKTPHLDRLAGSGVSFRNCYCSSPLCVPARASFMTGRLASGIDVFDNGSELKSSIPAFTHHLQALGYDAVLSGKMHFIGPDQLHGFSRRLNQDFHTTSILLTPDWTRGTYHNHGTGVRRLVGTDGSCRWNRQLAYDERVLYDSLEFIRSRRPGAASGQTPAPEGNTPFFLCTSFMHPHDPFEIPPEYLKRYDREEIPLPHIPATEPEHMHPYDRWIQVHHELDDTVMSDECVRTSRHAYFGMISYIDDKVGAIITELERMNLYENTIVIFVGDHGEMLGEHGMWFKRTFYDEALKVPLIVSWPGVVRVNHIEDEIVSLMDLGPTILGLLPEDSDVQAWTRTVDGHNRCDLLVPGTRGNERRDIALFEYGGEGPIEPMVGVRRGAMKYVRVRGHEPLLFDLSCDPHECTNLAGTVAYAETEGELGAVLDTSFDLDAMKDRIMASQRERLCILNTEEPARIATGPIA